MASGNERTPTEAFAVELPGAVCAGSAVQEYASTLTKAAAAAAAKDDPAMGRGRLLATDEAAQDSGGVG